MTLPKPLPVNPHLVHRRNGRIIAMEVLRTVPFGAEFEAFQRAQFNRQAKGRKW